MRYCSLPQPIGTNRTRRIVARLRSPIYRALEKVALQGIAYLDDLQAKVDAVKKLQSETAPELDVLMPPSLPRLPRRTLTQNRGYCLILLTLAFDFFQVPFDLCSANVAITEGYFVDSLESCVGNPADFARM